jgi:hypothetical protein
MTEPRAADPVDARLSDLLRTYTDVAATPSFDALDAARSAMSTGGMPARAWNGVGLTWPGRTIVPDRRLGVVLVFLVAGVVVAGLLGLGSQVGLRPTATAPASPVASGPADLGLLPDALRHHWQRPVTIAPGPDAHGSGSLVLTGDTLDVRRDVPPAESRSTVVSAGSDAIVVRSTAGTDGCGTGNVGTYRWTLEGNGTFLTLSALGADPCAARQAILEGPWVRSDLPTQEPFGQALSPGRHPTTAFAPYGDTNRPGQLSFAVPEGWTLLGDDARGLVLVMDRSDPANPSPGVLVVYVMAQPALAADFEPGAECVAFTEEPGVGHDRDALVQAIRAHPDLVVSRPVPVDIGGHAGVQLDLQVAPTRTRSCTSPSGPVAAVPILHSEGSDRGPDAGLRAGSWLRVILVDLGGGRTMAIVIAPADDATPSQLGPLTSIAMPIVESFRLQPPPR